MAELDSGEIIVQTVTGSATAKHLFWNWLATSLRLHRPRRVAGRVPRDKAADRNRPGDGRVDRRRACDANADHRLRCAGGGLRSPRRGRLARRIERATRLARRAALLGAFVVAGRGADASSAPSSTRRADSKQRQRQVDERADREAGPDRVRRQASRRSPRSSRSAPARGRWRG